MGGAALAPSSLALLRAEQAAHCDLLVEDFIDSYANATLDTMAALKFFNALVKGGDGPSIAMIADDDSYVDLEALGRRLFRSKDPPITRDSR